MAVDKVTDRGVITVNMDSQIPNDAADEWLRSGVLFSADAKIRREVRYGDSRFDFYIEDGEVRAFLEVKGVTLEDGGVASFPDAPTERGIKHINELVSAAHDGYAAYILFVIQMKGIHEFRPNDVTHKAFGDALRLASENGVRIIAMDCIVTSYSMTVDAPVKVVL